jgi:hypothetical protein
MDAHEADRFLTAYLDAVQTWEHTQGLMAEAAMTSAAALEACGQAEALRLQPPTVPRS